MINRSGKIVLFWYRRDLRLADNKGLHEALKNHLPVLPLFILDDEILEELPQNDARVSFIYERLQAIHSELMKHNSGILCLRGDPVTVWKRLIGEYDIAAVYANEDYEPYAIRRDAGIRELLSQKGIPFFLYKDQVIFEKEEIVKNDHSPYTVYTPYKRRWLEKFNSLKVTGYPVDLWSRYHKVTISFPRMQELGFHPSTVRVHPYRLDDLDNYERTREFPGLDGTSKLGPHLRFGTVSIREVISRTHNNAVFLGELIWREFFMQILYHFPQVVDHNFRTKYDDISWRNNLEEFEKWKVGETGYPIVDAGMRQLNTSGYMHNRVRMVTAGFLCKHLLIDWRWGEAYFAERLLDYELSSNNGNWQWAAGTGCDAAPYFRVFNPSEQARKFDPEHAYINKWVPEWNDENYPAPLVDHKFARERAIQSYRQG